MSVRINDTPHAPAMPFTDGVDLRRAGLQRALKNCIGIGYGKNEPNGGAAQQFGTVILVFGRLVADPELGSVHRESGHDAATWVLQAIGLDCSERNLIEFDSLGAFPH